jgi:hypothetical protein
MSFVVEWHEMEKKRPAHGSRGVLNRPFAARWLGCSS